jgi:polysaccharide biosynthesis/export protein
MFRTILTAFIGGLLAMAAATPVSAQRDPARTSANPEAVFADDYKLGVGDKVRIIVFNEESLSGEFQVSASGRVSLPLIGDVDATGETTGDLIKAIQTRLADGYLRDPRVSVEVLTYRPYFILGEVKTPAQYPYVNGMTVVNAIATAGGFTPRASQKRIYIRRSGEDQEKPYPVTPDLRVYPGDTIRVGERFF